MTIGFSFRTVAPRSAVARAALTCSAVCAAGLLAAAQSPATALADAGPGAPRPAAPPPSTLHQQGTQVRPRADAPEVPDVSALSWVVADARTGDVLGRAQRAPQAAARQHPQDPVRRHRAADAARRRPCTRSPSATWRASARAAAWSASPRADVPRGRPVARCLPQLRQRRRARPRLDERRLDETAAQMQAKARSLGANDTHVVSPGRIRHTRAGLVGVRPGGVRPGRTAQPGLRPATARPPRRSSPARRQLRRYGIQNTNRLLTGANGVERYPGLIGVKNGYTTNAGNTLVAAATHGTRTLVVTVMNPQSGGGLAVYEEARALLDWGFAAAGRVDPVGTLLDTRAVPARPDPRPPDPPRAPVARPGPRPPPGPTPPNP